LFTLNVLIYITLKFVSVRVYLHVYFLLNYTKLSTSWKKIYEIH